MLFSDHCLVDCNRVLIYSAEENCHNAAQEKKIPKAASSLYFSVTFDLMFLLFYFSLRQERVPIGLINT